MVDQTKHGIPDVITENHAKKYEIETEKKFQAWLEVVPSCLQIGKRMTLISSNTYLTYKEGENNMFLIIREKTFSQTLKVVLVSLGSTSQRNAEEKEKRLGN